MSLNCPDDERLFTFVEGGLDPTIRDDVGRHLESCPSCCRAVAAIVAARPLFPVFDLPAAFWEHYDRTFDGRLADHRWARRGMWQRFVDVWRHTVAVPAPLAATAALALVLLTVALVGILPLHQADEAAQHDTVLMTDVDAARLPASDYL